MVHEAVAKALRGKPRLVLAVSGGTDSMALLDAAAHVARARITAVATFDHGTGEAARKAVTLVADQTLAGKAGTKANRKLLDQMVRTGKDFEQLRKRAKLPPNLPPGPPNLRPWLDSIGQYLDRGRRPSRQEQYIQFHAAIWAGALLERYDHNPSKTRRSRTRRNPTARWDRLTAILVGTPSKSFFNSLSEILAGIGDRAQPSPR